MLSNAFYKQVSFFKLYKSLFQDLFKKNFLADTPDHCEKWNSQKRAPSSFHIMKGRECRGTTLVYQAFARLIFCRIATNCCIGHTRV